MSWSRWLGGCCGWALVLAARAAHADDARFAIDRFEPAERGSEWAANESLDLRGAARPSAGVSSSYAYRSFVLRDQAGEVVAAPVRDLAVVHAGASVVLVDRLRLAVDLPLQVFAAGRAGAAGGIVFAPPRDEQGIGDLRLGADVRVLGSHGDAVTGAVGVQVWAPTGQREQWAGDGGWRVRPRAMVAGEIGRFVYAAQLGAAWRERSEPVGGRAASIGSEVGFAVAAGARIARTVVVGPELFGSTVLDDAFAEASTPVEALAGVRWTVLGGARVGAAIGRGLTGGLGSPALRAIVSAEWAPGAASDADGDGIDDREDACPRVPGVRTSSARTNGCPPDRDGDGVSDAEDACPDVAGPRSAFPGENGCPDRDGDGVADHVDACPTRRGPRTSDPKTNGCAPDMDFDDVPDDRDACPRLAGIPTNDPATDGCPPDTDGDGIHDLDDACPTIPGPRSDDETINGCDLDRDKDGVPNDRDACPTDPGPPDPDPRRSGCPEAFVRGDEIKLLDQPVFVPGRAVLVEKESAVLDAVAKILADHPEIRRVRVEGHTDDRGDPEANRRLGAARAAAVVKWLVARGVDPSRLEGEGVGPDRPIDTNETEIGRARNRRIELHVQR